MAPRTGATHKYKSTPGQQPNTIKYEARIMAPGGSNRAKPAYF
ncbi:MAG: hypothetical protein ACM3JQ_04765 [Candidatus Eiseniibacteriota bacterium]